MGGTSVIINIEMRAPTTVYDLNRNKSPMTKPINPDIESQSHAFGVASVGNHIPRMMYVDSERNSIANTNRMMLTGIEPTLWLADSNAKAVAVQQIAVKSAANSPMWD